MAEAVAARRSRITPEREAELYEAVLDLVREVGYEGLTMDAVAARTHSSKATLYRQWGGKIQLVARALKHNQRGSVADIDTGSLRGDFHAMVARADDCQMESDALLLRSMAHAAYKDPELGQALRELFVEPELKAFDDLLRRAVERGEVPADHPALDYVIYMLAGVYNARENIDGRPMDRAFLGAYVDAVILPVLGV
ncbi:TetR/AcrR family transcriptional regulator [Streptomyces sp. AN091965]|uniref:TetR/AcrR family transcriptional regulator n=1 Tax=Streptomyces sp. AN091965 TaxID=2927803 RepID=UPI001F600F88|nr:TetR/AcrR family transcriptional regulator [Streptomyces sp. AN091965]MCI3931235.1 TetR/AcrR family transcriptional regulator [Streptomyces sp. AN091965]